MTAPTFDPGDVVVYTYPDSGRRYTCTVSHLEDGWVKDIHHGTCYSQSFRPGEVTIWEHKKGGARR